MLKKRRGYISKAELAMAYRPDVTLSVAERQLARQLKETPNLMDELVAAGYKTRQHLFTPKQIEIIYNRLGAP